MAYLFFVRLMSRSAFCWFFLTFALCSTLLGLQAKSGDPAVDGKDHLISDADFRSILDVSRKRIAGHPSYHIHRVHVVSREKVEVYVDDFAHPDWVDPHSPELQRSKNGWTVTAHSLDRDPIID